LASCRISGGRSSAENVTRKRDSRCVGGALAAKPRSCTAVPPCLSLFLSADLYSLKYCHSLCRQWQVAGPGTVVARTPARSRLQSLGGVGLIAAGPRRWCPQVGPGRAANRAFDKPPKPKARSLAATGSDGSRSRPLFGCSVRDVRPLGPLAAVDLGGRDHRL